MRIMVPNNTQVRTQKYLLGEEKNADHIKNLNTHIKHAVC